jgi:hypothetical protein
MIYMVGCLQINFTIFWHSVLWHYVQEAKPLSMCLTLCFLEISLISKYVNQLYLLMLLDFELKVKCECEG